MTLVRRLDDDELALLEVVEDPVWFAEFLRSTNDGSMQKEEWPKRSFKYRWYQRDLITDQTPYISLVGGRAIGKCHPPSSRIYTTKGYRSIEELRHLDSFAVYARDERTNKLVHRRAFCFDNGKRSTFEIITESNQSMIATDNHPILTPRGYVPLLELNIDTDKVAVATKLPHESTQSIFSWFELRWLGYLLGARRGGASNSMTFKYQKQVAEMRAIAKNFDANFKLERDGRTVTLERKKGFKAYATFLVQEVGWEYIRRNHIRTIPKIIREEKLDNIRIFLEAYFSLYADIKPGRIHFNTKWPTFTKDLQEVLLQFGIETKAEQVYNEDFREMRHYLDILDYDSYYRFFEEFKLPGITVQNLPTPAPRENEFYRFESIKSVALKTESMSTYGLTVWEDHNYICDNFLVHNSLVLEDKILWESLNPDLAFPDETKEQTLFTANMSQMTPILDRLILRLTGSRLMKDFLQGNINRSKGTFDFPLDSSNYRFNARIAGSRGDTNTVGLHQPKLKIDESQLLPMPAYTQMLPSINTWQKGAGIFMCGVPTGLREGNVLFFADQVSSKYKKYRVPAHNNPFFKMADNIDQLKQFGGADSEDYIHLVLGQHGAPAYSVIPHEDIKLEPFDFYTYRYNGADKQAGIVPSAKLGTPKLNPKHSELLVFALDTGFADPTVLQVFGYGADKRWRTLIRYRLTRIPFPDQIQIIDWLDSIYNPVKVGIDLGAGGGGINIMQELLTDRYPKSKKYEKRLTGVRFNDRISIGKNVDGTEMELIVKAYGGQQLAKMVAEQEIIFSELDMEGISQLERVAYERSADGNARYFVISERGQGVSKDDHIFASYVVFMATLLTMSLDKPTRRLIGAKWI